MVMQSFSKILPSKCIDEAAFENFQLCSIQVATAHMEKISTVIYQCSYVAILHSAKRTATQLYMYTS